MKEQDRLKKIRDFLLSEKKATWKQIKEATGIQDKELSYDLKNLIKKEEIEAEKDMKDRRITWYKLKDKNMVMAEVKRYETTEFILNMEKPAYYEVKGRKGNVNILLSTFYESEKAVTEKERLKTKKMVDTWVRQIKPGVGLLQPLKFKKIAVIFAFEKEGVKA
jgi:TRAP-type mannitol/chloroaromatic compound transport system substrate-binding protein